MLLWLRSLYNRARNVGFFWRGCLLLRSLGNGIISVDTRRGLPTYVDAQIVSRRIKLAEIEGAQYFVSLREALGLAASCQGNFCADHLERAAPESVENVSKSAACRPLMPDLPPSSPGAVYDIMQFDSSRASSAGRQRVHAR